MFSSLLSSKIFRIAFLSIIFVELISFYGFLVPEFQPIAFGILVLLVFFISLKRAWVGYCVLMAELIIGSKGHLFSLQTFEIPISIRLGLFLAVFCAAAFHCVQSKKSELFSSWFFKPLSLIILIILIGTIIGIMNQELKNVFLDVNGYLYFAVALIAFEALKTREDIKGLISIMLAALITVALKTFVLLFLFSHSIPFILPFAYRWIRITGVGEITAMESGFYRIFFQSHIAMVFAFFALLSVLFFQKKEMFFKRERVIGFCLLTVFASVLIISYSRSLWLGFFAGILVFFIVFMKHKKFNQKTALNVAGQIFAIGVASIFLVFAVIRFPYPNAKHIALADLVSERAEDIEGDEASASRMALLGPLISKAAKRPILGSGFGTTVTYQTKDPRALAQNPNGWYTTFAFEWGYLDFLVKIGILGLVSFAILLFVIVKKGVQLLRNTPDSLTMAGGMGLMISLSSLIIIHGTTPYLNHPLGIGFLVLGAATLQVLSKKTLVHHV